MIPFRHFIRQLCDAVNAASGNGQAAAEPLLAGYFHKETAGGTDLYTPREVSFRLPSPDGENRHACKTVRMPLASLTSPQTIHIDKVTFSLECSLTVKSGILMIGTPRRFRFFRKGMNTRMEFTLTGGGTPQELDNLIAGYEAALRKTTAKEE